MVGEGGEKWILRHLGALVKSLVIFCILSYLVLGVQTKHISGCASGYRRGLYRHDDIAPCQGSWKGHVNQGQELCGRGWKVCTWSDMSLRAVSWDEAVSVHGCFVYNAIQQHGNCDECSPNSISGRLAGVGRSCRNYKRGGLSCISGGVIDAGPGVTLDSPCGYDPHVMTGVLCCRQPVKRPIILLKPPRILHTYTGLMFVLPCKASGSPLPHIFWYKNGHQLMGNETRVSMLNSGELLISLTTREDSGMYTCQAVSGAGIDKASSQVTVSDTKSGCADRSTEGFHIHKDVQACGGRWRGHVKRAGYLCARGWGVCSPRDQSTLSEIGWNEITELPGCYGYNAANTWGRCTSCYKRKMAGVGHDCSRLRLHRSSCLAQGRVDVYKPRERSSCGYTAGVTSGVLCCRKRRRRPIDKYEKSRRCNPRCKNGGFCVGVNKCHCVHGYKGAYCHINRLSKRGRCTRRCKNGGRCIRGKCRCTGAYWGKACQNAMELFSVSQQKQSHRTNRLKSAKSSPQDNRTNR